MASVYFPKPRRFDVFKMFYVQYQQKKHAGNSEWDTYSKAYENLGGLDALYDLWGAFCLVSAEAQKRIMGFTDADINAFLEKEDASKLYYETVLYNSQPGRL